MNIYLVRYVDKSTGELVQTYIRAASADNARRIVETEVRKVTRIEKHGNG